MHWKLNRRSFLGGVISALFLRPQPTQATAPIPKSVFQVPVVTDISAYCNPDGTISITCVRQDAFIEYKQLSGKLEYVKLVPCPKCCHPDGRRKPIEEEGMSDPGEAIIDVGGLSPRCTHCWDRHLVEKGPSR